MVTSILQPAFAPNLYDLACILQSDRVVLDDLNRWSRKYRVHRALIRTPESTQYVSVPVVKEDKKKAIYKVRIDHSTDWIQDFLKSLEYNYRNSIYYDYYEHEMAADVKEAGNFEFLADAALFLRGRLFTYLELDLHQKEERLSEICADCESVEEFIARENISVIFQDHDSRHYQKQLPQKREPEFEHPVYRQHFPGFVPWCSLYDLLFQYGPESFRIIDQLKSEKS